MINAGTRREILSALLGAGAAGAFGCLSDPVEAALLASPRLPGTPLRLTRVLERTLGEKAAIAVERSWTVQCQQQARGIVVTGEQIAAKVTAPPHLAPLAAIEEARDASGMFPLLLSDAGLIMNASSDAMPEDAVAAALDAAEALIARQPVPTDERARYRLYLAQVHDSGLGLLDTLPPDLLFPVAPPTRREEVVTLPGGMTGQFALLYSARPQPDAPWLARAERQVVTRIAGLERRASEVWTLG